MYPVIESDGLVHHIPPVFRQASGLMASVNLLAQKRSRTFSGLRQRPVNTAKPAAR